MGVWKNGTIDGEGKAVYTNGEVYEGEFKAGLRDGTGTLYSADGLVLYDGDQRDNVEEGTGINYFCNGKEWYEGDFKAGQREGDNVYYWKNGNRYEGKWEDDVRNGIGEFISADGTRTAQIWLEDEFVTNLILNAESWTDMDGTVYTGKKENDEIEGYGRVVYNNRDIFVGQLKKGNRDGNGICYFKSYYGEWQNGKKTGTGVFSASDGSCYFGEYRDDEKSGYGVKYYPDGSRYEVEWQNDKRNGTGTLYYADGTKKYGTWADGEYQN